MSEKSPTDFLSACILKSYRNIERLEAVYPRFPHAVRDGEWTTSGEKEWKTLTDGYWTPGFFVGILFLCHSLTADPALRAAAERWLEPISRRAGVTTLHDVGFLFFPSAVLGHTLTGEDGHRGLALTAARSLLSRFQPDMGFLNVHDSPKYRRIAAVDTMMNLPLLWWAWSETGDGAFREAAETHAENTWRRMVREDGSTIHILRFHDTEPRVVAEESWQGLSPGSCWSRGQAWAITGYAHAFAFTGEAVYRERFMKLLDYYLQNAPDDLVPFWDFGDPAIPGCERDASAAAIVVHGITAALKREPDGKLLKTAKKIIHSLTSDYTTPSDHPAFLKHVCFHKPAGIDPDTSSIFADFYYLKAMYDLIVED
ncbi:MAG: glycoside hydrolase family 88 protein [bacterium]